MELFIKPVEFEKTAYSRVSENPAEWTRDVMEQFYNVFPYFMTYPVRVEFTQKDEQKGYAVGSIKIETGAQLAVPIIIKNRELYPFDVCIFNGATLPLTNYTINTYLSGKSPFQRSVSRDQGDITTLLFGQGGLGYMKEMPIESYKMAEAVDPSISLLDLVLPHTSSDERQAVLQLVASDDSIAEGFKRNGTGSAVIKIASSIAEPVLEKAAEKVEVLLDRDIWYISKTGEFEYRGIFGNSRVDDPKEFEMSAVDVEKVGSLVKCAAREVKKEHLQHKPVAVLPIRNSNRAMVLLENGDYVEIPQQMYIDAPVRITMEAPGQKPELRKVGCFKIGNEYTEPFEVTAMWKTGGVTHIEGTTSLERTSYALLDGVEEPYSEHDVLWLPGNTKFVKLGKCHEAKAVMKQPRNKVVKTAGGFVMKGPELGGYVGTMEPVSHIKAAWALVQCGADEADVEKLASMREGQELEIWNELELPKTSATKIAAEYEAALNSESVRIRALAKNLVKEASVIPSEPTVDKVLALNFVNKDSIDVFTSSLPMFESLVMSVADMLLKTRLGVQVVEEIALRRVMFDLLEIIEVLQGVVTVKESK
jgi:hypothetical protein